MLVTPDMLRGCAALACTPPRMECRRARACRWCCCGTCTSRSTAMRSRGQYVLPWTYLHAIKDYTDMAAHLEANPAARAVVNFTPVLIEQLEEIARRVRRAPARRDATAGSGAGAAGPATRCPPSPPQRLALLRACLRAHRQHMIERFGPYLELADDRRDARLRPSASPMPRTSSSTISPSGITSRGSGKPCGARDPLVARLTERGRGFTAAQRRDLLSADRRAASARCVPRYPRAAPSAGRSSCR